MEVVATINRAKYDAFKWRYELSIPKKLILALGIAGDITKAVVAAAITRGITPKRAYNGEVDKDKWAKWRLP